MFNDVNVNKEEFYIHYRMSPREHKKREKVIGIFAVKFRLEQLQEQNADSVYCTDSECVAYDPITLAILTDEKIMQLKACRKKDKPTEPKFFIMPSHRMPWSSLNTSQYK